MDRDRHNKSWREVDRGRDRSAHGKASDRDQQREETARANAATKKYKSALEALFAPKPDPTKAIALPKTAARIVLPPNPEADPRATERQRLLAAFLAASGPVSITKAADAFTTAGFNFPDEQDVYLQMLEHTSDDRVKEAIDKLTHLLAGELPKRKPVLDQRLRRIEDQGDDPSTRTAAQALRRTLRG